MPIDAPRSPYAESRAQRLCRGPAPPRAERPPLPRPRGHDHAHPQGRGPRDRPREYVSIVGASGSGKSTLLYLLGGLDRPTRMDVDGNPFDPPSAVFIDGQDTAELNDQQLAELRNEKVGFVFQFHYLLKEFTAQENVALPMFKLGRLSRGDAMERAAMLLEAVRPRRQAPPPRQPPLRRRAAARRDRPGAGERAGGAAGRRAHRQPRPQEQRARRRDLRGARRGGRRS